MLILSAGSNACGQLANGGAEDSHLFQSVLWFDDHEPSEEVKVKRIACGGNHTLVLLDDGQLWAGGDGQKGQIGSIKSSHVLRRLSLNALAPGLVGYKIVDVAASWETSYIVLRRSGMQDVLLTMGSNDYGDRGIGTTGNKSLPDVSRSSFDSFFESIVDSNSIRISSITAGPHHIIIILLAHSIGGQPCHLVVGWGASRHGQLGQDNSPKPPISFPSPRKLQLQHASRPISIACGNQHSVVAHDDGNISFFGSNKKSQLECLSSPPLIKAVHCTWNGTCLVPSSNDKFCLSGSNSHGQLGTSEIQRTLHNLQFSDLGDGYNLEQVSAGSEHILAFFQKWDQNIGKERVKTLVLGWGWNEHGNLGLGHITDVFSPKVIWPTREDGNSAKLIESVWTGCGTSWIVLR